MVVDRDLAPPMVFGQSSAECVNGNGGLIGMQQSNRRPKTLADFDDDSMMDVVTAGDGSGGVRGRTGGSNPAAADVNHNSPGHHSSQDGSFIQDETEMNLILDFNRGKETPDMTSPLWNNRQPVWANNSNGPPSVRPSFQPSSVLTASWIGRQRAQWATDFDANLAELDFDNGTTREILGLPQPDTFGLSAAASPVVLKTDLDGRYWASIGEECLDAAVIPNGRQSAAGQLMMKGSLELSSGESLFSSTADAAAIEGEEAFKRMVNGGAGISTDSLDMSTFDAEQLLVACETKKQDYMLTFQQASVMGASAVSRVEPPAGESMDYVSLYTDAQLSKGGEQVNRSSSSPTDEANVPNQGSSSPKEEADVPKMESLTESQKLTTWGRIKRTSGTSEFEGVVSNEHNSVPNVDGCQSPGVSSGGEGMPNEGVLECSDLPTSPEHHPNSVETTTGGVVPPISLLRVFRNKLSVNNDSCGLSSLDEDTSSGYATGEKSDNHVTDEVHDDYSDGADYEYAEYYVGNGRYIDVNQNEIGYVPPSTKGVQSVAQGRQRQARVIQQQILPDNTPTEEEPPNTPQDRWIKLSPRFLVPVKPPRTFTALLTHATDNTDAAESSSSKVLVHSSTQVPVYVSDRSIQTVHEDNTHLTPTVTLDQNCDNIVSPCHQTDFTQPSDSIVNPEDDDRAVPDLGFLQMPFQIPQLFPSCAPFPLEFLANENTVLTKNLPKLQRSTDGGYDKADPAHSTAPLYAHQAPPPLSMPTLTGNQMYSIDKANHTSAILSSHLPLFPPFNSQLQDLQQHPMLTNRTLSGDTVSAAGRDRDSGCGSSGPSNISDWESLATLLPKDVLQACSFFKSNSHVLGKSDHLGYGDGGNGIEKPVKRRPTTQCRYRPQSYDPSFNRCHRWKKIESIREEDDACDAAFDSHCRRTEQYHSCYGGTYADREVVRCRRHQRGASAAAAVHRRPQAVCHQPIVVHCCGYTPPAPRCCHSASAPPCCHADDVDVCLCSSTDCPSGRMEHHRDGCCSLKPCADMTDSGRDCTEHDEDEEKMRADDGTRETPSVPPAGLAASTTSSRTDEDDGVDVDDEEEPLTMASEYQLRDRDSCVDYQQFRSLHNLKAAAGAASVPPPADVRPCATCYKVRSPTSSGAPPVWAQPPAVQRLICDCRTADVLDELERARRGGCWRKLRPGEVHPEEAAVRGTSVFLEKKKLVDDLVQCCRKLASIFPANSPDKYGEEVRLMVRNSLCPAVEALVTDGLADNVTLWSVVTASATLGPATKPIHALVTELTPTSDLSGDEEQDVSQFYDFIQGLLERQLLDCWLSYTALKDVLLASRYSEAAFLRRASASYRSLFDRAIAAIQPLSVLAFDRLQLLPSTSATRRGLRRRRFQLAMAPTRLPSDSRVPKSSSIPARLAAFAEERVCERQEDPRATAGQSHSVDTGLSKIAPKTQVTPPSTMSRSRIPVLKMSPAIAVGRTPVTTPTADCPTTVRITLPATEHKSKIARPNPSGRKP